MLASAAGTNEAAALAWSKLPEASRSPQRARTARHMGLALQHREEKVTGVSSFLSPVGPLAREYTHTSEVP
jgi:hypothetical protein